jgi:DNA-binding response OmpR family regulator
MAEITIAVTIDDPTYLGFLHEILTDAGYATVLQHTTDGLADMLWRAQPALLMLDVRMEEPESGLHTLMRLRQAT